MDRKLPQCFGYLFLMVCVSAAFFTIVSLDRLVNMPLQYRTSVAGGNLVCIHPDLVRNSSQLYHSQLEITRFDEMCSEMGYAHYWSLDHRISMHAKGDAPMLVHWIRSTFSFLKRNDLVQITSLFYRYRGEIPFVAEMRNCVNESGRGTAVAEKEFFLMCRHSRRSLEEHVVGDTSFGPVHCSSSATVGNIPFRSDLTQKIVIHAEPKKNWYEWLAHYEILSKMIETVYWGNFNPPSPELELPRLHIVECFPEKIIQ